MNRILIIILAIGTIAFASSCRSTQASRSNAKNYDPETGYEATPAKTTKETEKTVVVEPTPTPPATETKIVAREESVKVVQGEMDMVLSKYNIILGSFKELTNAQTFKGMLAEKGFTASLLQNEQGMYRVRVFSTTNETTARTRIREIKEQYPEYSDAWLLIVSSI